MDNLPFRGLVGGNGRTSQNATSRLTSFLLSTTSKDKTPLKYYPASHGYDRIERKRILYQEYQLYWGEPGDYITGNKEDDKLILEFQKLRSMERTGEYKPVPASSQRDLEYVGKKEVALAAYQRAFIRYPKFRFVEKEGDRGRGPLTIELAPHCTVFPVFTSSHLLKRFWMAHNVILNEPSYTSVYHGDYVCIFSTRFKQFDLMLVDPAPNFKTYRGILTTTELDPFPVQSEAITISKLLDQEKYQDPILKTITFQLLISDKEVYTVKHGEDSFIQVFVSTAHRDAVVISQKKQGKEWLVAHKTLDQMCLLNLPSDVKGITLESLPPEWTCLGGLDYVADKKNFFIFERVKPSEELEELS